MKLRINRANLRWSIGSIGFGLTVGMISAAFHYGSDAAPILDVLLALTLFSSLIALGITYLPTGDTVAHDVVEYEMLSIPTDEPSAIEFPQNTVPVVTATDYFLQDDDILCAPYDYDQYKWEKLDYSHVWGDY